MSIRNKVEKLFFNIVSRLCPCFVIFLVSDIWCHYGFGGPSNMKDLSKLFMVMWRSEAAVVGIVW